LFEFFTIFKGLDCCSDQFTSFHYISEKDMTKLSIIINRHEELMKKKIEKEKPKFKTIIEEFLLMDTIEENIVK
jgi:hypothetical protein